MRATSAAPAPVPPVPDRAAPAKTPRSPAERRVRLAQIALATLSGALYVLAFPGLDQWYLALLAFVPVLAAARQVPVRRAIWLGAIVGFTSHLGGYYWVTHLLRDFAFLALPFAVLGWLLVCAVQGASFGVGVGLAVWLRRRAGWPFAVTLAIGLTAMDFLYPLLFPSYIANTMGGALWMMQTADLFGVLGVTALVGAINGALADAFIARREGRALPKRVLAIAGAVWAAALVYGGVRVWQADADAAKADKLKVGLVQANLGGHANLQKRGEGRRRHVRATRELSAQGVELVVWPEGALGAIVDENTNVRDEVLGGTPQALLFGATRYGIDPVTGDRAPFNTAFLADGAGRVRGWYDKTILLAFGEYVPGDRLYPGIYDFLENRGIPTGHFGRGASTAPLELGDWKLGTYICYEDIIPRFVRELMQPHEGTRPHVMVNVTNDSWYGDTTEPPIHLSLAKFRAVEHRRALVRSTNTGISAFVEPSGRVAKQTRTYREETLVHDVPRMTGTTLYQLVGDLVGYLALAAIAVAYFLGRRRAA